MASKKKVTVTLNPALHGRTVQLGDRWLRPGEAIEFPEGDDRLSMRVRHRGQLMRVFVPYAGASVGSGHAPHRRGRHGTIGASATPVSGHEPNRRTSGTASERGYDAEESDEDVASE